MKTVLITGASRGIGAAIAKKYIQNNYNVAMCAIKNIHMLEEIIENNKNVNQNIMSFCTDISNIDSTQKMLTQINQNLGPIDILINNAAISHVGLFTDNNDINKIIGTNLSSVIHLTKMILPNMINQKNGVIINISSIWGNIGASLEVIYSTSKGGINAFTKALAKEVGPSGISVNAIAPGVINTDMNQHLTEDEKNCLLDQIPLGRFGEASEVANLCYFLSSDEAKYIQGQIITIDGGLT